MQGDFSASGGWLYLSFAVNLSVCYAFYCLGMFYYVLKAPLQPFDPVPKFLCIKAVLFLSFWQVRGGLRGEPLGASGFIRMTPEMCCLLSTGVAYCLLSLPTRVLVKPVADLACMLSVSIVYGIAYYQVSHVAHAY